MYLFDPYYLPDGIADVNVESTPEHPFAYNRIVPFSYFNRDTQEPYALGSESEREAVLLYDTRTKLTEEKTVEYFI